MAHTETATNDSVTESSPRPSRRKRRVAAASCVGLVAAIAEGGYWWHSTRVPNLTRVEAWTRYIELIEGGKYDEALSYSPYLQGPHDDGDSIEFLSDAAHAHAPSTISIEPVDNIDNPYSIEGHVSFNDGTDVSAPIVTFLSQKDKANGKLGWWHIEDPSFGTTISLLELDNLRSVRVGGYIDRQPTRLVLPFPRQLPHGSHPEESRLLDDQLRARPVYVHHRLRLRRCDANDGVRPG